MDGQFPNFRLDMDLTMEQEFKMRIFQESIRVMNPEEARLLLAEASKLLMVKDNIIKGLMKREFS